MFRSALLSLAFLSIALLCDSALAREMKLSLKTGISGQEVSVATNFGAWRAWRMREVAPGSYEYAFEEPWLPEIQYKFIVDGRWMEDPGNPRQIADGLGGVNSVAPIESFHEDPLLSSRPGMPAWKETQVWIRDLEGSPREITVVSPESGYTSSFTVYFQDGGDYLSRTGVRELLSNLSTLPGMPAFTGVFIPPKDREREYEVLPAYADFVAKKVVPTIESSFPGTGGNRKRRLLIGPSLGGLITVFTALRHPDVFGFAASQSGALWLGDGELLRMLSKPVSSPQERLKIFLDCGIYEDEPLLQYNRVGFNLGSAAGHEIAFREYPSTHDWIAWRNRLQEILRYFFAPQD